MRRDMPTFVTCLSLLGKKESIRTLTRKRQQFVKVTSSRVKEDLLKAVLQSYVQGLGPQIVRPAYESTDDPIERIFAILAGYRARILQTNCQYGCPLGRLALEIDPENRPAHVLIAKNFGGWIDAVRQCLVESQDQLPSRLDLDALATHVLTVMEGGVMLSRSYGSSRTV